MLDLAGPDPIGKRPERTVRGGVAIAAHDGHPWLGEALLRADHVDDPLVAVSHRVAGDAELGAVAVQRLELGGRDLIGDREVDVGGGDVVVCGRQRQLGVAYGAPGQAESIECLGRGDLVNEVQVNEEQVRLVDGLMHHVGIPDLLGQGLGCSHDPILTISTVNDPPGAS